MTESMQTINGWCRLAIDGGPPVRGERVALGDDLAFAPSLIEKIREKAGVAAELVLRPLAGVALILPAYVDTREIARGLDAEHVTAGYLDHQGRACVALPADAAHIAQAAHGVAKVLHLLVEIHTDFINAQSDRCELPDMPERDAEQAATALLDAIGGMSAALGDWRQVRDAPDQLQYLVAEGLALLRDLVAAAE
jgi:hypothetical protein